MTPPTDLPHFSPQSVLTCLCALPRGGPDGTPDCPVLGTEGGDILVLDPDAFTVLCKVRTPPTPKYAPPQKTTYTKSPPPPSHNTPNLIKGKPQISSSPPKYNEWGCAPPPLQLIGEFPPPQKNRLPPPYEITAVPPHNAMPPPQYRVGFLPPPPSWCRGGATAASGWQRRAGMGACMGSTGGGASFTGGRIYWGAFIGGVTFWGGFIGGALLEQ